MDRILTANVIPSSSAGRTKNFMGHSVAMPTMKLQIHDLDGRVKASVTMLASQI